MIVPLNKFIEEKSKFSLPRTSFSPVSPSNVIIFYIQSFFESSRYHQRIVPPFPRRPGAPKHQTNCRHLAGSGTSLLIIGQGKCKQLLLTRGVLHQEHAKPQLRKLNRKYSEVDWLFLKAETDQTRHRQMQAQHTTIGFGRNAAEPLGNRCATPISQDMAIGN